MPMRQPPACIILILLSPKSRLTLSYTVAFTACNRELKDICHLYDALACMYWGNAFKMHCMKHPRLMQSRGDVCLDGKEHVLSVPLLAHGVEELMVVCCDVSSSQFFPMPFRVHCVLAGSIHGIDYITVTVWHKLELQDGKRSSERAHLAASSL